MPQSQNAAKPSTPRGREKWQKITRTKQTNAREAHRPAPSFPSEVITMLKRMTKHEDKERGKTPSKHEAPLSIKHKATQNKNNTGATALERGRGGGVNIFNCRQASPWVPMYFLIQKKIHKKFGSHSGIIKQLLERRGHQIVYDCSGISNQAHFRTWVLWSRSKLTLANHLQLRVTWPFVAK